MAVAAMLRLDLFGLRRDLPDLLDILQRSEAVQIEMAAENLQREEDGTSERIEHEISDLERLMAFFDRIAPQHPNLVEQIAGIKTVLTEEEFAVYAGETEALQKVMGEASAVESELNTHVSRRQELENRRAQLFPWSGLELTGSELREGTRRVRVLTVMVEPEEYQDFARLLPEKEPRAVFAPVAVAEEGARVVLFWPRDRNVDEILADLHFVQVALPSFTGRVSEALAAIDTELTEIDNHLASLNAQALTLSEARPRAAARLDFLRGELAKIEAAKGLDETRRAFSLSGWIPAKRLLDLEQALTASGLPHSIQTRPAEPGEDVPVELENAKPFVPFEALITSFSRPRYGEIDPTPVTAPFFFIFFGFCVSDAGYGLVLSLFCLSMFKWLKMGPAGKRLAKLFILGGIASILMGFLTGGIFGDLFGYHGPIDPIENALIMMGIALALGVVQLFIGIFLAAVPSLKTGRWRDALFNQGIWLIFLVALMLLLGQGALGLQAYGQYLKWLAILSALGVVYSATRDKKGILNKLLSIPSGLYSIYGSIGFFSDVLSYIRLMALGLSSGVMAVVINMFVRLFSESGPLGLAAGVLVGVFGHTLNIALALLGAYVHSSRLQFLEFFGKFYEGGGRPFKPLRLEHKRVFVVKQREA